MYRVMQKKKNVKEIWVGKSKIYQQGDSAGGYFGGFILNR